MEGSFDLGVSTLDGVEAGGERTLRDERTLKERSGMVMFVETEGESGSNAFNVEGSTVEGSTVEESSSVSSNMGSKSAIVVVI